MTSNAMRRTIAALALVGLIAALHTSALAAKAGTVGKLPGKAYVVKVTPDGKWLAAWSEMGKKKFTLFVVDLEKGDRKEVVTVDDPGGLCWLANKGELLYCKGLRKASKVPYTLVTYYVYKVKSGESKKVGELNDLLQDYQADPISAEDGSLAFHLTLSPSRTPSFNIYFAAEGRIKSVEEGATISADYDLSSDGSKLAWFLHGKEAKHFAIALWDLEKVGYIEPLFEWVGAADPADNHMMLRLDMPHAQAATLAVSDSDKQLNACIYRFVDPKNLQVVPVKLAVGDEAFALDWKGRSGLLTLLVRNQGTKKFSLQEFNPSTGVATRIIESPDEINHFEYAATAQAYFYSVITQGAKPETVLVKVK
jgi:hypothetical protein